MILTNKLIIFYILHNFSHFTTLLFSYDIELWVIQFQLYHYLNFIK